MKDFSKYCCIRIPRLSDIKFVCPGRDYGARLPYPLKEGFINGFTDGTGKQAINT